jgi:ubiquinone/menaquinone biosynthesis C-methylase UbiE
MNHNKIFNTIAREYGWFFNKQVKMYTELLEKFDFFSTIDKDKKILDAGCGTGALAFVLASHGYHVTALDASAKMIEVAKKKVNHEKVNFVLGDIFDMPFEDHSFDVILTSYVVHGFKKDQRTQLYMQFAKKAKEQVLIIEFSNKRRWFIDFIENLEGSDYLNFIQNGYDEMKQLFSKVECHQVLTYTNIYQIKTPSLTK